MNQTVTDYEVVDHGIYHSQYFQGCGVCFTKFDHVVTGCGNDFSDALSDALDSMAQHVGGIEELEGLDQVCIDGGDDVVPDDAEDTYYYVSIRYNVAEGTR